MSGSQLNKAGTIEEQARRSVAAFRAMQPSLSAFARALTGRSDVSVVISTGHPRTDGTVIYYRPPLALGSGHRHDLVLCDTRHSLNALQLCLACRVEEEVYASIFHEIAHIAYGTFDPVSDHDKIEATKRAIKVHGTKYAKAIEARINSLDLAGRSDYLDIADTVSPFLSEIVNVLEDTRIDHKMFDARRGTKKMFDAMMINVFQNGIEIGDGSVHMWRDSPLNAQAIIGVFCLGADYDYTGWFYEDVEAALSDEKLRTLSREAVSGKSVQSNYNLSFDVLARLRELGFCKAENDPEDEETPDDEPESEEQDAEPPEDGSDDGGNGGEQQSDSTEGQDPAEDKEDGESGSSGEAGAEPAEDDHEDDGVPTEGEGVPTSDSDSGTNSDSGESDDSGSEDRSGNGSAPSDNGNGSPSDHDDEPKEEQRSTDRTDPVQNSSEQSDGGLDEEDSSSRDDNEEGADSDPSDSTEGQSDSEPSSATESERGDDREDESSASGDDLQQDIPQARDISGETELGDPDSGNDPVVPKPIMGTVEEIRDLILSFMGHEDIHAVEEDASKETVKAVTLGNVELDTAIMQGMYFETPSVKIIGVKIHKRKDETGTTWIRGHPMNMSKDGMVPESILGPATLQTRRTFDDNKRAHHDRNRKSGRINGAALGKRAPFNDERMFGKRTINAKKSYSVVIGIDVSGSTVGSNIVLAKRAAMAQAELCNRVNIDFAVYAHSSALLRENGARLGTVLDMYEVKSFDEPWSKVQQKNLNDLNSVAGNLDGHSIEFYRKMVERTDATDKIILYYSDGKMPAENHDEELLILKREIKYCKQRGIELLGVGIRTDSPKEHGLDTVQINRDSDLIKVVQHLAKRLNTADRK